MQLARTVLARVTRFARCSSHWSTTVENVGSTARDHLANERTFLAWARTGLGFVGSGTGLFTAYHLHEDDDDADAECSKTVANRIDAACLLLIMNGGIVLALAGGRYYRIQRALQQGSFIMARGGLMTACATTAVSTVVALGTIARADTIRREERKSRKSTRSTAV